MAPIKHSCTNVLFWSCALVLLFVNSMPFISGFVGGSINRLGTGSTNRKIATALAASESTTPLLENEDVTAKTESEPTDTRFVSPRMQVFIEDTDAYGIMYNTNYLRAYDRALHMSSTIHNPDIHQGTMSSQHEGWSITSFDQQKFKSSPKLGEEYVIRGEMKESEENSEVWDMEMTSPDGDVTYNTISNLKIVKRMNANGKDGNAYSLQSTDTEPFHHHLDPDLHGFFSQNYPVYRDEIDAHWPNHLPLRAILNYFERCRSASLGGPDELRRLKEEDGIVAVVTGILTCSLIDEGVQCYPGQVISSESFTVSKRKGMVIECYQTIKHGSKRIAQGQVNLMLLDSQTRKPKRNVPERIQTLLQGRSTKTN